MEKMNSNSCYSFNQPVRECDHRAVKIGTYSIKSSPRAFMNNSIFRFEFIRNLNC